MIIDTHAHYDDEQFDTDRDVLLNSMHDGGIGLIVNAGSTLESWGKIMKLTEDYPFIYGAIGIHPDEVGTLTEEHMSEMERLLDLEKIVAVARLASITTGITRATTYRRNGLYASLRLRGKKRCL